MRFILKSNRIMGLIELADIDDIYLYNGPQYRMLGSNLLMIGRLVNTVPQSPISKIMFTCTPKRIIFVLKDITILLQSQYCYNYQKLLYTLYNNVSVAEATLQTGSCTVPTNSCTCLCLQYRVVQHFTEFNNFRMS